MKKLNKKGFTIVELVIVIAVIAILAAVMIPTFSGIVKKANESAALQDAKNAYTALLYSDKAVNGDISSTSDPDAYIVVDDKYYFTVESGELKAITTAPAEGTLSDTATNVADYEKVTVADVATDVEIYLYTAEVAANPGT